MILGGDLDVSLVKVTRVTIIVLGSSGDLNLAEKTGYSIARYLDTCFIEEHGLVFLTDRSF
jgi:molecular chaperone DnaK (HSP70)